jgi:ribosomal protein S18 acetylase RimI-like enzyme
VVAEPGILVREVRPEEHGAVGDLVVAAYAPVETDAAYLAQIRDTAARVAVAPVLVAVDGQGSVLGTATYVPGPGAFAEFDDPGAAGIRVLAVAPWAQGRGVGRALALACIERARADGRTVVAILTRPAMRAAQALYSSLGFQRDEAADWEFEPGEWLWGYRLVL